jgi:hypothetical protein
MKDNDRERVGSFLTESEINECTDDKQNNITPNCTNLLHNNKNTISL